MRLRAVVVVALAVTLCHAAPAFAAGWPTYLYPPAEQVHPFDQPASIDLLSGDSLSALHWVTWGEPVATATATYTNCLSSVGTCTTFTNTPVIADQREVCDTFEGFSYIYGRLTISPPRDRYGPLRYDLSQPECWSAGYMVPPAGIAYPAFVHSPEDCCIELKPAELSGLTNSAIGAKAKSVTADNLVWSSWDGPVARATGVASVCLGISCSNPAPAVVLLDEWKPQPECGFTAYLYTRVRVFIGQGAAHTVSILPSPPYCPTQEQIATQLTGSIPPCDVVSASVTGGGIGGADIFTAGSEQSVQYNYLSDGTSGVSVDDTLRVGLEGIFGDQVGSGQGSAGASLTIAGGLEVGLGMDFDAEKPPEASQLVSSLLSGGGSGALTNPPPQGVALKSINVSMGAWLTGDLGTSVVKASVSVEGVIGARISTDPAQPDTVTYFMQVSASGSAEALSVLKLGGVGSSAGGEVQGSFTASETEQDGVVTQVSLDGSTLSSTQISLDAGLSTAAVLKEIKSIVPSASSTSGREYDASISLDLADPITAELWQQAVANTPVGASAVDGILNDTALLQASQMTLTEYNVQAVTGKFELELGAGVGFRIEQSNTHEVKTLVSAVAKPATATAFVRWMQCESAAQHLPKNVVPASLG